MTLYEIRLFAVLGILALGIVAILAAGAITALAGLARRLDARITRPRTLPSLRGDATGAARMIDHRQAAWRLRC
jgi:hypothetical protein